MLRHWAQDKKKKLFFLFLMYVALVVVLRKKMSTVLPRSFGRTVAKDIQK